MYTLAAVHFLNQPTSQTIHPSVKDICTTSMETKRTSFPPFLFSLLDTQQNNSMKMKIKLQLKSADDSETLKMGPKRKNCIALVIKINTVEDQTVVAAIFDLVADHRRLSMPF